MNVLFGCCMCYVVNGRGSLIASAICVFACHDIMGTTGGKGKTIRSKGYIDHHSPNVPQIWSCIRYVH